MKNKNQYLTILLVIIGLLLSAFLFLPPRRIHLVVNGVPKNTPLGASIFIAGNFNYWDPGDGSFQLQRESNGRYFIDLPLSWGTVNYKFTRGDWTSVEADACGHKISDRQRPYPFRVGSFFTEEVVEEEVYSWEDLGPTDCKMIVIRVKKIPKETPKLDPLFIAGSFNDWNSANEMNRLKKSPKGYYYTELTKTDSEIEFKFTRGAWDKEEVDMNGDRIPNRKFSFGQNDTLDLEIDGWVDVKPGTEERMVNFLVTTPYGAPLEDNLYIVGSFNSWKPEDSRYKMKRLNPHLFSITIRKPEGEMEYKFTRGQWGKEEVDVFGNHISNRRLRTSADTVKINIPEWVDIPVEQTFTMSRDEIKKVMHTPEIMAFPPSPGVKNVFFGVKNTSEVAVKLFVRVSIPSAPGNRNYGFVTLLEPKDVFPFVCPVGTNIYACDGKYWADFKPKECLVLTVDNSREGVELDANWLIWKKDCNKIELKNLKELSKKDFPLQEPKLKSADQFEHAYP